MRIKVLAAALTTSAVALAAAGPASAGEITAKGKFTPVSTYTAKSICSFSGLNDGYVDPAYQEGPDDTARTQTPRGAKRIVGYACNGSGRFAE